MPHTVHNAINGTTFILDRVLGKGQFGTVNLATVATNSPRLRTGALSGAVAIKILKVELQNNEDVANAMCEINILKKNAKTSHPNVIQYLDSWRVRDRFFIVMEYAPNGTLEQRIKDMRACARRFTEFDVKGYAQQLMSALHWCHATIRVVHRDLKPANVLIDKFGTLKLADFGVAKQLSEKHHLCETQAGTPLYMAPEMTEGGTYTYSVDCWMLGCVLYEIMALTSPWAGAVASGSFSKLMLAIKEQPLNMEQLLAHYSRTLCRLIAWMMEKDPEKRPRMEDGLKLFEMRPLPTEATEATEATNVAAAKVIQTHMRTSFRSKLRMIRVAADARDDLERNAAKERPYPCRVTPGLMDRLDRIDRFDEVDSHKNTGGKSELRPVGSPLSSLLLPSPPLPPAPFADVPSLPSHPAQATYADTEEHRTIDETLKVECDAMTSKEEVDQIVASLRIQDTFRKLRRKGSTPKPKLPPAPSGFVAPKHVASKLFPSAANHRPTSAHTGAVAPSVARQSTALPRGGGVDRKPTDGVPTINVRRIDILARPRREHTPRASSQAVPLPAAHPQTRRWL